MSEEQQQPCSCPKCLERRFAKLAAFRDEDHSTFRRGPYPHNRASFSKTTFREDPSKFSNAENLDLMFKEQGRFFQDGARGTRPENEALQRIRKSDMKFGIPFDTGPSYPLQTPGRFNYDTDPEEFVHQPAGTFKPRPTVSGYAPSMPVSIIKHPNYHWREPGVKITQMGMAFQDREGHSGMDKTFRSFFDEPARPVHHPGSRELDEFYLAALDYDDNFVSKNRVEDLVGKRNLPDLENLKCQRCQNNEQCILAELDDLGESPHRWRERFKAPALKSNGRRRRPQGAGSGSPPLVTLTISLESVSRTGEPLLSKRFSRVFRPKTFEDIPYASIVESLRNLNMQKDDGPRPQVRFAPTTQDKESEYTMSSFNSI